MYNVRFKRKDLREFEPGLYVTGDLTIDDVIDLKEVFDAYDSTGMGVLLPNDLKLFTAVIVAIALSLPTIQSNLNLKKGAA